MFQTFDRHIRRGNAMVLVAGLLVLLVIVATAFLTRSRSARQTADAQRSAATRDIAVDGIISAIADDVVGAALFPRPIDAGAGITSEQARDGNARRLDPGPDFIRWQPDPADFNGNGLLDFAFNQPQYAVVPWTNWPDALTTIYGAGDAVWPRGEGNPGGPNININEANPLGDPGFGDTRWLADAEPQAWDGNQGAGGDVVLGQPNAFRRWRHLSYIGRPDNGFRVVGDLSDVMNSLVLDLRMPIEQWVQGTYPTGAGVEYEPGLGYHRWTPEQDIRWEDWFFDHPNTFADPTRMPSNFFAIDDPLANGYPISAGEEPSDEFRRGTARWSLARRLADADGDGFTDSYWWLVPSSVNDGIRQVAAVRIVDNSAKINVNTATRFVPGILTGADPNFTYATAGETPADIALVGVGATFTPGTVTPIPFTGHVGLFDRLVNRGSYANWLIGGNLDDLFDPVGANFDVSWDHGAWEFFLASVGEAAPPATAFRSVLDRRFYFNNSGVRPLDPRQGFTPFAAEDEAELRMYHASNSPWSFSRLEAATTEGNFYGFSDAPVADILRSGFAYQETTPYLLRRLDGYEFYTDLRHRLTVYNGARNDLKPPWLRWRWDLPQTVLDNIAAAGIPFEDGEQQFFAQTDRKIDLREYRPTEFTVLPGEQYLHERLAHELLLALIDHDETGGDSVFGTYTAGSEDLENARKLAAALAANILSRRDDDRDRMLTDTVAIAPLFDDIGAGGTGQAGAIPLPQLNAEPADLETRMLGLEPQPFLTEAAFAFVYEAKSLDDPPSVAFKPLFGWPGNYVDDSCETTVVFGLQLANPFDHVIPNEELRKMGVRIFDQEISFEALMATDPQFADWDFRPSTNDNPATLMILITPRLFETAEFGNINDFGDKFLDFFDMARFEDPGTRLHPDDTELVIVRPDQLLNWSEDPDDYVGHSTPGTGGSAPVRPLPANRSVIELIRYDPGPPGGGIGGAAVPVVIDRFDYFEDHPRYDELLDALGDVAEAPAEEAANFVPVGDPDDSSKPGIRVGDAEGLVTLVGVRRSWDDDVNARLSTGTTPPFGIDATEVSPRYVFAEQQLTVPPSTLQGDRPDGDTESYSGVEVDIASSQADSDTDDPANETSSWIVYSWQNPYDSNATFNRRPTWFDGGRRVMNQLTGLTTEEMRMHYKGWFVGRLGSSFQIDQKEGDFQQVGEVLNTFCVAHELAFLSGGTSFTYDHTRKVFAESLLGWTDPPRDNSRIAGRLGFGPVMGDRPIGTGLENQNLMVPNMPGYLRVMSLFVCDGPGFNWDPSSLDFERAALGNAAGFSGRATPGLLNVNTASLQALQSLPYWYRLMHLNFDTGLPGSGVVSRRVGLPEALIAYRERYDSFDPSVPAANQMGIPGGPGFRDRGAALSLSGLRGERGLADPAEIMLLQERGRAEFPTAAEMPGSLSPLDVEAELNIGRDASLRDFGARSAFNGAGGDEYLSTRIGADVTRPFIDDLLPSDGSAPGAVVDRLERDGDMVAGDAEERNMLYSVVSNLTTVTSDVFTVYLRIRSFRQRADGIWDATDAESIVDDARYVVTVDRSNVNRPGDEPRILHYEKVPY